MTPSPAPELRSVLPVTESEPAGASTAAASDQEEPRRHTDETQVPDDAERVTLRLGLQRRASANFRRHFVRHLRRVIVLLMADVAAILVVDAIFRAIRAGGAEGLTEVMRLPVATPRYLVALLLGLTLTGNYSPGDRRRSGQRLLLAVTLATLLELWTIVWTVGADPRVLKLGITAAVVLTALLLERFAVDRVVATFAPIRQHAARTVFAGPAGMCREAAAYPALCVASEFRQIGFLDAQAPAVPDALGTVEELPRILHDLRVDTVVICGVLSDRQLQVLVGVALTAGCHILTVPRAIEVAGVNPSVIWSHGVPLMQLSAPALHGQQQVIKRAMDLVVAVAALSALAPVMGLVALAIWIDSRGSIFFRQSRVGLGGREFRIVKFRTMVQGADTRREELRARSLYADGRLFKVRDDPRVTRVGAVLRRTSLDELPQFWNVLRGDMSLVGPRPPMTCEVELYEAHHYGRFDVKPGITGPWQVNGRNAVTDFEEVMRLERDYISAWSIWKDLKLLLRTVPAVLFMRGAQ